MHCYFEGHCQITHLQSLPFGFLTSNEYELPFSCLTNKIYCLTFGLLSVSWGEKNAFCAVLILFSLVMSDTCNLHTCLAFVFLFLQTVCSCRLFVFLLWVVRLLFSFPGYLYIEKLALSIYMSCNYFFSLIFFKLLLCGNGFTLFKCC